MTSEGIENMNGEEIGVEVGSEATARNPSNIAMYNHFAATEAPKAHGKHKLKMPTLDQLLAARFKQRQYRLNPWLREQENCMVYAATGVGKSLFALSAALAVAGGGEFLGWQPDTKPNGEGWRVLYIDGEMHTADIQERVRQLLGGMPKLDKAALDKNLNFLARQHQDAGVQFPSITEQAGQAFVLGQVNARSMQSVGFYAPNESFVDALFRYSAVKVCTSHGYSRVFAIDNLQWLRKRLRPFEDGSD